MSGWRGCDTLVYFCLFVFSDYQQPRDLDFFWMGDLDFYKRLSDCIRGRAGRDGGGEESKIC